MSARDRSQLARNAGAVVCLGNPALRLGWDEGEEAVNVSRWEGLRKGWEEWRDDRSLYGWPETRLGQRSRALWN